MAGPARFPTLLVLGLVLLPNNTANTAFVGRFRQEVEPKRDFLLQGTFPVYTELPQSRLAYNRPRRRPGSISVCHTKIPGTIGCAPTRLQSQGGNMSKQGRNGRKNTATRNSAAAKGAASASTYDANCQAGTPSKVLRGRRRRPEE